MAPRGSKKALSVEQEDFIAWLYCGDRSPSSGGAATDNGDVRLDDGETLFECKGKFGTRLSDNPVRSTLLQSFEKIADEAYEGGRDPALALRFYKPESPLSDTNGYVDLTVRLSRDDATRIKASLFTKGSDGA